jgi:hypothetical protein
MPPAASTAVILEVVMLPPVDVAAAVNTSIVRL